MGPARTLRRYASAAEVEALEVPEPGDWIYAWAWEEEAAGRVRARAFPGRGDGIDEDEATGAAALLLTAELGRALNITQGRGRSCSPPPAPTASWNSADASAWRARSRADPSRTVRRPHALSGNSLPSWWKTALLKAKARLHSSTIRCFSRSSAFTPSSSSVRPLERGRVGDPLEDVEADAVALAREAPGALRLVADDLTARQVAQVARVVVRHVAGGPVAGARGDPLGVDRGGRQRRGGGLPAGAPQMGEVLLQGGRAEQLGLYERPGDRVSRSASAPSSRAR